MKKNYSAEISRLICFILFAMTGLPACYAGPLSEGFSATFQLSKNDITVADVTQKLHVNKNILDFTSFAQAAGIASILTSDTIFERSVLEMKNGKLRSQLYSHDQKSHKFIDFVIFNWSNNTIINTGENKTWPLRDNTYDLLGVQIALAQTLKTKRELVFSILDKNNLTEHRLNNAGNETLQLIGKKLKTTRLDYRDNKRQRTISFWCAEALDYLPVRIERKDDDGDTTVLELNRWNSSS